MPSWTLIQQSLITELPVARYSRVGPEAGERRRPTQAISQTDVWRLALPLSWGVLQPSESRRALDGRAERRPSVTEPGASTFDGPSPTGRPRDHDLRGGSGRSMKHGETTLNRHFDRLIDSLCVGIPPGRPAFVYCLECFGPPRSRSLIGWQLLHTSHWQASSPVRSHPAMEILSS